MKNTRQYGKCVNCGTTIDITQHDWELCVPCSHGENGMIVIHGAD